MKLRANASVAKGRGARTVVVHFHFIRVFRWIHVDNLAFVPRPIFILGVTKQPDFPFLGRPRHLGGGGRRAIILFIAHGLLLDIARTLPGWRGAAEPCTRTPQQCAGKRK